MNAIDAILKWMGNKALAELCHPVLKFKKLSPEARTPEKAHFTDAGYDLWCIDAEMDYVHRTLTCHTGIAIDIPDGYVGLLCSRSSI